MTILRHLHRCPKVKKNFATCSKLGHFREHDPKMPEKQTIFQSVTAYNKMYPVNAICLLKCMEQERIMYIIMLSANFLAG